MFVLERLCESYDRVGVRVSDSFDSPLLSVSTREVCRSDHNFLADSPVKRLVTRHSIYSYTGSAYLGGDVKISPSDRSLYAMHFKVAIVDTDDLVSKYG